MYTTLIETEAVAALLEGDDVVIVDARYDLADLDAGRRIFERGHIPGAVFADLGRDLSAPPGGGRGRHPLPDVSALADTMAGFGIGPETQVVTYDGSDGAVAARVWWLLKYLGHDAVAVLDGGFVQWVAEGREVETAARSPVARAFVPRVRSGFLVTIDEVERLTGDRSRLLVDSRSPERFRGEIETLDPVAGHIPGAVNRYYRKNVESDGRFRTRSQLRDEFERLLEGRAPAEVVFYCGSGVTACHNLLALEYSEIGAGRLYAGSWSEWCSSPDRPVEQGDPQRPSSAVDGEWSTTR